MCTPSDEPQQQKPARTPALDEDHENEESDSTVEDDDTYGQNNETYSVYKARVVRLCHLLWPSYPRENFLIGRINEGDINQIHTIRVTKPEGDRAPSTSKSAQGETPAHARSSADSEVANGKSSTEGDRTLPGHNKVCEMTIFLSQADKSSLAECSEQTAGEPLDLPPGDYILRVPRPGCRGPSNCKHQVDMLRFVRDRVSVKVPTVVHFDTTSGDHNPLGGPYMLLERIAGQPLRIDVLRNLSRTQRLSICLDMVVLYKELAQITNRSGGIPNFEEEPAADGTLATYDFHVPGEDWNALRALHPQSAADMLCQRLARMGNASRGVDGSSSYLDATEMVSDMQETNRTFGDEKELYYLTHGDIHLGNILVEVSGPHTASVTGVIDWDYAFFAPPIVSFSPPSWLWRRRDGEADIQALFDQTVGFPFLDYAYSPDGERARDIWFAAYRFDSSDEFGDVVDIEKIYKEWKDSREADLWETRIHAMN